MTPELGYHPAHVFPAAALHVAAEQKRNDFLAAMNKQNLMQKESVSPKNADEAEKNEEVNKNYENRRVGSVWWVARQNTT